jgi:hypothetical protein
VSPELDVEHSPTHVVASNLTLLAQLQRPFAHTSIEVSSDCTSGTLAGDRVAMASRDIRQYDFVGARVDHLVVGSADLQAGVRRVEERLGMSPTFGGAERASQNAGLWRRNNGFRGASIYGF